MVAFTGYINELYNADTGKLLGYEVRETLSSITYNTLWFDLADISGINSVKYDGSSKKFYVNGSATEWANKKVGITGGVKAASRRFDIEFRTQYFYVDGVEVEVQVPMLFVQEEQYGSLSTDVASENSGVNISVTVSSTNVNKIKSDYATLIDIFIANKADIDVQTILDYIGNRVTF